MHLFDNNSVDLRSLEPVNPHDAMLVDCNDTTATTTIAIGAIAFFLGI